MKAVLGRRYHLSASHRLFCPEWDLTRNLQMFGKCANPHGHGHNYTVEVLLAGEPDPVTGMVVDLRELDETVRREVVRPFDHQNLNTLSAFAGRVPTSETLCIEVWDRLRPRLPLLRQVRVEETPNNSFTYRGGVLGE